MSVETPEEYRKRLDHEWGTFVAVSYIQHDGVLIAKPGDAVPVSNVEAHGYLEQGLVARVDTKAAKAAAEAIKADTEKGRA